MKFYLLVEGRRTEKKLYRAWLSYCFPGLKEVDRIEDLAEDNFLILAGMGYPSYLGRIPAAIKDVESARVDHFFVCVDAEDMSIEARSHEIKRTIQSSLSDAQPVYSSEIHIIIQDCCIETWLLGHQKLIPRTPTSEDLLEYKRFYDVSVLDPEGMGRLDGFVTKAQFHCEYLREVFRHHRKHYSKENPGIAMELNYLQAMIQRYRNTGHMASLGHLWSLLTRLGAGQVDVSP